MQRITPAHSVRILTNKNEVGKPHPNGDALLHVPTQALAVVFATCADCHDCAQDNEGYANKEGDAGIITAGLVDVHCCGHEACTATSEKEADSQDDVAHGCFAPVSIDSVPIVSDFEADAEPLSENQWTTQALSLRNTDAPLHVPTSGNAPSQALKQPMLPDCPCCGEMIVTIGYQSALVRGRRGHWMVHCVNEDCALYMATCSDIHEAWAMRGKPILGGAL